MYQYNYENLKEASKTKEGKAFLEKIEKQYKKEFENVPVEVLNYSFIKDFYKDGDRKKHETLYFNRRKRLRCLQVLAIKSDEYLEPLEQILFNICNEQIWVVPAHNLIDDQNIYDESFIDLFAAETAFYLAETLFVLNDKLSADIKHRISLALREKIVKNMECRTFWWETKKGNNWAAVCAGSVGLVYLYAFPERFDLVKSRIFDCMKTYLNSLDDDGYCGEGVGYWEYGFGFFSIFFDVYKQFLGDEEIFHGEKIDNILHYIFNAQMERSVFLPFADGGRPTICFDSSYLYAMENLYGINFDGFLSEGMCSTESSASAICFRTLYGLAYIRHENEKLSRRAKNTRVYYEKSQVFVYKGNYYSFATKGGNNKEPHNHNDLGVFQIVSDGKRLISDIGAGLYTKQYFYDKTARYGNEIFVCGSQSHSVPIVDGKCQSYGKEFFAEVLACGQNYIEYDISKGYDVEGLSLKVKYEMKDDCIFVKYSYSGVKDNIVFRFISDCDADIDSEFVRIRNMSIVTDLKPVLSEKFYQVHGSGQTCRAVIIDYIVKVGNGNQEFVFDFQR